MEAYPQTTLCSSLSWGCTCIQIYLQVPPLFWRWRPHRPSKKVGSDGGQTPFGMAISFEVAIEIGIMDPRNGRMIKFQLQILFSWSNLIDYICVDYNLGTCSSRSYTGSTEMLSPTCCWVPAKGSWRGGLAGTCWGEPLGISIITKVIWSPIGLIYPSSTLWDGTSSCMMFEAFKTQKFKSHYINGDYG